MTLSLIVPSPSHVSSKDVLQVEAGVKSVITSMQAMLSMTPQRDRATYLANSALFNISPRAGKAWRPLNGSATGQALVQWAFEKARALRSSTLCTSTGAIVKKKDCLAWFVWSGVRSSATGKAQVQWAFEGEGDSDERPPAACASTL